MTGIIVLVVEDDPSQLELLTYNLTDAGFRVVSATSGANALDVFAAEEPDIVLLDWMLPGKSGIKLCRNIRAGQRGNRHVPIILVSARTEEDDLVKGLEAGADDYICKPFAVSELLARMKAHLRRSNISVDDEILKYADIEMKTSQHRVFRAGVQVELGPTEYRLLAVLLRSSGRVLSRGQLLDRIWGPNIFVEERTVDVHIGRLRKALGKAGGRNLIRTVRGAGYSLE